MKKTISILGSTGSIGQSSLSIIGKKKKLFKINYLSANKNFKLICRQIIKFKPKIFIIRNKKIFNKVKKKFKNKKIGIINTFNLKRINKNDITIAAIPGLAGLEPTIAAIKNSKKILIANKESIICGWSLIKRNAKKYKTQIIPVDSEHYSIFNLLEKEQIKSVKRIIITASGGPFLKYNKEQLKHIKPKDALKHPKWKMGKKISVDSSTLMNKIFEIAEAEKLFNIPNNKLKILIHPESLVHAIIEFKTGLKKFIYHDTSMIIPLANAIFESNFEINEFLKLKKNTVFKNLSFENVKTTNFPLIKIKKKINEHPSSSIIYNAANEILVDLFLQKKVPFLGISKTILKIHKDGNYLKYAIKKPKNILEITKIDNWVRKSITKKLKLI